MLSMNYRTSLKLQKAPLLREFKYILSLFNNLHALTLFCVLGRSSGQPPGADPRRCGFVHVVAVHAEKKIIPSNDLENVD